MPKPGKRTSKENNKMCKIRNEVHRLGLSFGNVSQNIIHIGTQFISPLQTMEITSQDVALSPVVWAISGLGDV